MSKKLRYALLGLIFLGSTAAVTVQNDKLFEISKNLEIFISVYRELNTNFVDELDPSTMMRTAIDAMTHRLDPYTNYVSESEAESYWINDDEKYQGIGAKVGLVAEKLRILEPFEGGPAHAAGIRAGDQIVAINGVRIEGKKMEEINAIMRGLPGTDVTLTVIPNGKDVVEDKKMKRGEVNIPNVPYSGFVSDDVGYISLTVFTQNASNNISKALRDLKGKNPDMAGVILDLRQNGGGLLHEAVNICNLFVPTGEAVVSTKGKIKERDQIFKTLNPPTDLEIPLAILIDKRSASASEIVSGVIQDLDRGVLIGQRSFGKGLVQNTKELPYNSRLKLTTSKYYIPSGRCIQGVEYENGEPKDIPDSQRSKFRTRNGRTVLDGGGVTPDVKLPAREILPVTQALLEQHVIFEYANKFCAGKDSLHSADKFKFSDYNDFIEFVKKYGFKYETQAEKHLKLSQEEMVKQNKTEMAEEVKKLLARIENSKSNELMLAKSQITGEIEKEIVSRYQFQKGRVRHTLDNDNEIKEAVNILKDTKRYKALLSLK